MKVLIVDNCDTLHKGKYDAEQVIIIYDWGHKIITKHGDVQEFCTDLRKLLSRQDVSPAHLEAVSAWLERYKDG